MTMQVLSQIFAGFVRNLCNFCTLSILPDHWYCKMLLKSKIDSKISITRISLSKIYYYFSLRSK